jgi:hypothetical protein
VDIDKTELQHNEESFTLDMVTLQNLLTGDWSPPWVDATRDNYKDIHRLLQRVVDLANHAGSHAMKIEYLRLGEVPDIIG